MLTVGFIRRRCGYVAVGDGKSARRARPRLVVKNPPVFKLATSCKRDARVQVCPVEYDAQTSAEKSCVKQQREQLRKQEAERRRAFYLGWISF